MLLKIKETSDKWYSFFSSAIKNRLRRDLNLSDLTDVVQARKNIELDGDNNATHFHDSRYMPQINENTKVSKQNRRDILQEIKERIAADNELRKLITDSSANQQNSIDKLINDLYEEIQARIKGDNILTTNLNVEKTERNTDVSNLLTKIDIEKTNRINADENLKKEFYSKFVVSLSAPTPIDGCIWFDIGTGFIKYWNGSSWIIFGSSYK